MADTLRLADHCYVMEMKCFSRSNRKRTEKGDREEQRWDEKEYWSRAKTKLLPSCKTVLPHMKQSQPQVFSIGYTKILDVLDQDICNSNQIYQHPAIPYKDQLPFKP